MAVYIVSTRTIILTIIEKSDFFYHNDDIDSHFKITNCNLKTIKNGVLPLKKR